MIGIATRGYSVGKGPDKLASHRKSGDVDKKLRYNDYMFFREADELQHIENFHNIHEICSGDTSRSNIVPACSPYICIDMLAIARRSIKDTFVLIVSRNRVIACNIVRLC